jgi:hypothetical protein
VPGPRRVSYAGHVSPATHTPPIHSGGLTRSAGTSSSSSSAALTTGKLQTLLQDWPPISFSHSCRYDAQDAGADDAQPTAGRGNVRHRTRMHFFAVVQSAAFFSEAHVQAPNLSFGPAASPQRLPLHVKHPATESGLSAKPSLQRVGRCGLPLQIYGMFPPIATPQRLSGGCSAHTRPAAEEQQVRCISVAFVVSATLLALQLTTASAP